MKTHSRSQTQHLTISPLLQLIDYKKSPRDLYWEDKGEHRGCSLPQFIKKMVDKAVIFSAIPNTLVVKFEDLSGNNGRDNQLNIMKKINRFCNIKLEAQDYDFLMTNLFGNKIINFGYFYKGESNSWKKKFDNELNLMIYHLYGDQINFFGYSQPEQVIYPNSIKSALSDMP